MANSNNAHAYNTFKALLDVGDEYDASAREVSETILRVVLNKLGKTKECECRPEDIVVRNREKWHKPHCKKCWRWSQPMSKRTDSYSGTFKPLISDFERDLNTVLRVTHSLKDQQERRQQNDSLQGDLR